MMDTFQASGTEGVNKRGSAGSSMLSNAWIRRAFLLLRTFGAERRGASKADAPYA